MHLRRGTLATSEGDLCDSCYASQRAMPPTRSFLLSNFCAVPSSLWKRGERGRPVSSCPVAIASAAVSIHSFPSGGECDVERTRRRARFSRGHMVLLWSEFIAPSYSVRRRTLVEGVGRCHIVAAGVPAFSSSSSSTGFFAFECSQSPSCCRGGNTLSRRGALRHRVRPRRAGVVPVRSS